MKYLLYIVLLLTALPLSAQRIVNAGGSAAADSSTFATKNYVNQLDTSSTNELLLRQSNGNNPATFDTTNNYHRGRFGIGDFSVNAPGAGLHLYGTDLATVRLSDSAATDAAALTYFDFWRGFNTTNLGRVGFSNGADTDLYFTNLISGGALNFQTDGITKGRLLASGQWALPYYGDTTFTGTAVKYLGVTDDGLVIEVDGGTGGGDTIPAVQTPTLTATTTINLASNGHGIFNLDFSTTSTQTTLAFTNPYNGGEWKLWVENCSTDTIVFPDNFLTISRDSLLGRACEGDALVEFFYDGTNYITTDTLWASVSPSIPTPPDSSATLLDYSPIWYVDADSLGLADSDAVAAWNDESGNAYNFSQATSGKRPTFRASAINGLAAVDFDGTDDNMRGATVSLTSDVITVALVATWDAVTGGQTALSKYESIGERQFLLNKAGTTDTLLVGYSSTGSNLTTQNASAKVTAANDYIIVAKINAGTGVTNIYVNGVLRTHTYTASSIHNSSSAWNLGMLPSGATESNFMNGKIAVAAAWDSDLTTTEMLEISDLLNLRYSVY